MSKVEDITGSVHSIDTSYLFSGISSALGFGWRAVIIAKYLANHDMELDR
jgi:ABC-type anion transport system duplicated permease subunit